MGVQLRKLRSNTFSTLGIGKLFPTSKTEGQTLVSGKVNVILCNFLTRISIWSSEGKNRDYWMNFWGPGFLAVILFCFWPIFLPPFPVRKLSLFLSLPVCHRWSLLSEEAGGGGEGGAKSYDREKAWSSINHPILSGKNVRYSFLDLNHFCSFTYCVHCTYTVYSLDNTMW